MQYVLLVLVATLALFVGAYKFAAWSEVWSVVIGLALLPVTWYLLGRALNAALRDGCRMDW